MIKRYQVRTGFLISVLILSVNLLGAQNKQIADSLIQLLSNTELDRDAKLPILFDISKASSRFCRSG